MSITNKSLIISNINTPIISQNKFSKVMYSLGLDGILNVAVAISGGSDSLCLTLLLKQWTDSKNINYTALIVNHQLRENIELEINQLINWLKSYNIKYKVLTINPIDNSHKLQEQARLERYKVLLNYCKKYNIPFLGVAHHFNDLLETVSMREKRKNNLWGHAGISLIKNHKNTLVFRPLLFFTKKAIQNTLKKLNQDWIEDPSNNNLNFERVQVRKQLEKLEFEELKEYFCKIYSYRNRRISLEKSCLEFLTQYINITKFGVLKLHLKEFLELNTLEQIAILGLILKFCANKDYMPKISKIINTLDQLNYNVTNKIYKKLTLGGCLLYFNMAKSKKHLINSNIIELNFIKESRVIMNKVDNLNDDIIWDKRFFIKKLESLATKGHIANLSNKEYNRLYKYTEFKDFVINNKLSKEVVTSLPWLFINNKPKLEWVTNLLNPNYVKFLPTNSLLSGIFCNFSIAKI